MAYIRITTETHIHTFYDVTPVIRISEWNWIGWDTMNRTTGAETGTHTHDSGTLTFPTPDTTHVIPDMGTGVTIIEVTDATYYAS